ncbi:hypothetical protein CQ14_39815 [Bradyrhizobium lablabi]|uniref:Uncharacterized protein n=1 Tax=Bradyrhizobium lablabi TaxID=722472 RepID=A0A0R3MXB1_9BRAD|nr:hypothetical protein CQ14_39815 [Bradyrhizobium lablabi]
MRWLPRMWWMRRLPRMRWLSRLRRLWMQSLPMRLRLWRLRWLRHWLDWRGRAVGSLCRLLCILGPVPLVLTNDAF